MEIEPLIDREFPFYGSKGVSLDQVRWQETDWWVEIDEGVYSFRNKLAFLDQSYRYPVAPLITLRREVDAEDGLYRFSDLEAYFRECDRLGVYWSLLGQPRARNFLSVWGMELDQSRLAFWAAALTGAQDGRVQRLDLVRNPVLRLQLAAKATSVRHDIGYVIGPERFDLDRCVLATGMFRDGVAFASILPSEGRRPYMNSSLSWSLEVEGGERKDVPPHSK